MGLFGYAIGSRGNDGSLDHYYWLGKGFGLSGLCYCASFYLLIIRDAVGLRRQLGNRGSVLNDLVDDLEDDNYLDKRYPQLLEKLVTLQHKLLSER